MKKMIRFTVLLLMITGVFIFSSGEKVAAATTVEKIIDFGWDANEQEWITLDEQELYILFSLNIQEVDGVYKPVNSISIYANQEVFGVNGISTYTKYDLEYHYINNYFYLILENLEGIQILILIDTTGNIISDAGDDELDYGDTYTFTIIIEDYHDGTNGIDGISIIAVDYSDFPNVKEYDFYTFSKFNDYKTHYYELREIENRVYIYQVLNDGYTYFSYPFDFVINYDSSIYSKIVLGYLSSEGIAEYESTFNHINFDMNNLEIDFNGVIIQLDDAEIQYIYFEYNTSEPDPEYTITFNTNGGSAVDPIVVTEGAMLYETIWNPPVETTRSGYTFDDWYKNAGLTIPVNESDTVTSDITLYANWILNVVNYTVTFNTNGGSYIAPQSIVSGEQASRPTDPVKTGYTFNGWYTEMFFINLYNFNSAVSDNITLYAQWTLAEDPIEDEDDAWDVVVANLPWIILGLIFVAIIFKR